MIVSIHIPKTAGTTIAYILDYGSSRSIMYDYKEDYVTHESLDLISKHIDFIENYFKVLHGHFLYSKYEKIFPNAQYIVTLRHPVERVISQYNHMMNVNQNTTNWPAADLISGKMDIVDFASIKNIGNAQANFIADREIEEFDHVFITERLDQSIRLFQKKFGFVRQDPCAGKGVPVINERTIRKKYYSPTDAERQEIFARCKQDTDIYRRAIEKHNNEVKNLL